MENILAIRIGEEQHWDSGIVDAVDTGLRAILSVRSIFSTTSSYTIYGDSLYMIWYDVGQLSVYDSFSFFCKQFYTKSKLWYQLSAPPPNPLMASSQIYLIPQAPPPPPIAKGRMTLVDSGYDPLKAYFLTFEGNFDLTCPLFKGFQGVTRNIPNYQIRIS